MESIRAFINENPKFGFGNALITDVNDEWIKEQVIIAIDIKSLFDPTGVSCHSVDMRKE